MTRAVLLDLASDAATTAREQAAEALEHCQTAWILVSCRLIDALGGAEIPLPAMTPGASVPELLRSIDAGLSHLEHALRGHADFTIFEDLREARDRIQRSEEAHRRACHETAIVRFVLAYVTNNKERSV